MRRNLYGRWTVLLIRYSVKNIMLWVLFFLILGSGFLLRTINSRESMDIRVLLCDEGSAGGAEIVEQLRDNPYDGFDFVPAGGRDEVIRQVTMGNAACGVVFPSDLDERIAASDTVESVYFYSRPETIDGEIVKEIVAERFLRTASGSVLRKVLEEHQVDADSADNVLSNNQKKLEEYALSIFATQRVETPEARSYGAVDHVWGFVLWLLFLAGLLSVCEWDRSDFSAVYQVFGRGSRLWMKLIQAVVLSGILAVGAGLILFPARIGRILCFAVLSAVWASLFRLACRKLSIYEAAIPVVMLAALFVHPILYDFAGIIPGLTLVRRVFPFVYVM